MADERRWTPQDLSPEFWETIAKAAGSREKLRPLLEQMSREEIYEFYREYEAARTALHDPEYLKAHVSEDDIDDIAMWVIAQGQATYQDIHDHPDKTPAELPGDEGLGFNDLAARVFEDRFGKNLFDLFYR